LWRLPLARFRIGDVIRNLDLGCGWRSHQFRPRRLAARTVVAVPASIPVTAVAALAPITPFAPITFSTFALFTFTRLGTGGIVVACGGLVTGIAFAPRTVSAVTATPVTVPAAAPAKAATAASASAPVLAFAR
jgi:hypothetical protein